MGCCFYDLCSPRRKIYGTQSSGEPSQSPRFNKHSLITRHQGQTSEGVERGKEEHRSPAGGGGGGDGGQQRGRGPQSALFSLGPASRLPLGGAGPATTPYWALGAAGGPGAGKGARKPRQDRPGEGGFGRGRSESFCPPPACGWFPQSLPPWPLGSWDQDGFRGQGHSRDSRRAEARLPGAQSEFLLGICPPPSPQIKCSSVKWEWTAPPCRCPNRSSLGGARGPRSTNKRQRKERVRWVQIPASSPCSSLPSLVCATPTPRDPCGTQHRLLILAPCATPFSVASLSCLTAPLPHHASRDPFTNKLTCTQILNPGPAFTEI